MQVRLRDATAAQEISRTKLSAAGDALKLRIAQSSDYQQAKRQADDAKMRVTSLRVSGGDGLTQASQEWIRLAGIPNRMLVDAAWTDATSRTAQTDYDSKTAIVISLQKQITDQRHLAALQAKRDAEDAAAQQASASDTSTGATTSNGGNTYSGSSGGGKDQHVSGYTRKDGTHVNSYNRRSK